MKSILALISLFIMSCSISYASGLKVAASIFPLYSIVKNIAVKNVEVKLIVPPLASPHTFEFTPRSIAQLKGTKVIFCIGHKLDAWALIAKHAYGKKVRVITVDKNIEIIQNNRVENPHYWLSPLNAIKIAENVKSSLQHLLPEREREFDRNYLNFKNEVLSMYRKSLQKIKPYKGKSLLTYHRAYDYFAKAYGLNILGSFQPPGGKGITPRHIKSLMEKIKRYNVKVFFIEPQIPLSRVKSFISDLSLKVYYLDPLGGVKGRENYVKLIQFNVNSILSAFKGETR